MGIALIGVLGVVVGGIIGLAAQLLSSRAASRQKWAETRRVVYSEFIEGISVSRRRLEDAARARAAGGTRPTIDASALHLEAVAGWNRVRLISRSPALLEAARELGVRIQELRDLVEAPTEPSDKAVGVINEAYNRNREDFMDHAQQEIGLSRSGWRQQRRA